MPQWETWEDSFTKDFSRTKLSTNKANISENCSLVTKHVLPYHRVEKEKKEERKGKGNGKGGRKLKRKWKRGVRKRERERKSGRYHQSFWCF